MLVFANYFLTYKIRQHIFFNIHYSSNLHV